MIQFGREICTDLTSAIGREWLETNGIGGFASSTVAGLNTRRYHGLLCAATRPPVGRLLLLSKLEETLVIGERRFELSTNQYAGAVHPNGYQYLKGFRIDPFPTFIYEVEGLELQKQLFMIQGENTTVVEYSVLSADACQPPTLEVRPLVAFRDYHATTHENQSFDPSIQVEDGLVSVQPYPGLPRLFAAHNASRIDGAGYWYRNFEYEVERERGLDFAEDLFCPVVFTFDLTKRPQGVIIASTERREANRSDEYRSREVRRRQSVVAASPCADELVRHLVSAADQYIVNRGEGKTIIAGYHWFTDWGRDTMIALPGLTLATGRADVTRSILLQFAGSLDQGMLPNRCRDAAEQPEYNTVDATLWFFDAVRALLDYTGDYEFVRANLYDRLVDVIEWHERGTRYGIRVDEDGLLLSGEPGVQLTWMDSKVGDYVVTPRHGKAVEIQALWYNALRVMEDLAHKFDDGLNEGRFGEMAARAKRSFGKVFWNDEAGCLYDVVNGEVRDGSIRPNQIFPVSLGHSMLSNEKARRVVEVVERELLTPYGLRSLAPRDHQYRTRYDGDVWSRDTAYHQGTVWAWLMGPFVTAYVRVNGGKEGTTQAARKRAKGLLDGFSEHLRDAGLGHVSEIFDADTPHSSRGCIAQAWSVAEILRAAVEDVFQARPPRSAGTKGAPAASSAVNPGA